MNSDQIKKAHALICETSALLTTQAGSRNYWFEECQKGQKTIAELTVERDTLKEELTRQRENTLPTTKHGKGVEYWCELATSSCRRIDALVTQLREKEKTAAEWERKFFATADELDRTRGIVEDARDGQNAVQAELNALKEKMAEQGVPVAGKREEPDTKRYVAVERSPRGIARIHMSKDGFFRWVGAQGADGTLRSFTDGLNQATAIAYVE